MKLKVPEIPNICVKKRTSKKIEVYSCKINNRVLINLTLYISVKIRLYLNSYIYTEESLARSR